MFIKELNIGKFRIAFVFRHRYEKKDKVFHSFTLWSKWTIGIWFKKNQIVGSKKKGKEMFSDSNLVNDYMFGIDLLIIKLWFDISYGGLHLKIDED